MRVKTRELTEGPVVLSPRWMNEILVVRHVEREGTHLHTLNVLKILPNERYDNMYSFIEEGDDA